MLLDNNLILFDDTADNLAATGDPSGSWIDVNGLGIETSDLVGLILFKTVMDAATAMTIAFATSANSDFSSDAAIVGATTPALAPATTAVPAGRLYAFPLAAARDHADGNSELSRYVGFTATYTGSPASDEQLLVTLIRLRDLPAFYNELI